MKQPTFFDEDPENVSLEEALALVPEDDVPAETEFEPPRPQLLTVRLLKEAIRKCNSDDSPESRVLEAYAETILPKLLSELVGATAKGGEFMERIARENPDTDYSQRDSWGDQSLVSHLLNGMLPTMRIIRRLRERDPYNDVNRYLDERGLALFVACYTLHDWNKFPNAEDFFDRRRLKLRELDIVRDIDAVRAFLRFWTEQLDIITFLERFGARDSLFSDLLIWLTVNTQEKHGTSLPTVGLELNEIPDGARWCVRDLSRLSDLFVSVVVHPSRVEQKNIREHFEVISNGLLRFAWHQLSENRGLLTNVVNNALLALHEKAGHEPLMFFPHGVVYVAAPDTPSIDKAEIPDRVVAVIKELCAGQLRERFVGFGRDGKGFKFADYYRQFFTPGELVRVGARAAFTVINDNKTSCAGERSAKLVEFQRKGLLPADAPVAFGEDIRTDQLAEFCDLAERKIAGDAQGYRSAAGFDAAREILDFLGLENVRAAFDSIGNLNEAIRQAGEKGNTGGVPLPWYFAAAEYVRRNNPRPDELRETVDSLAGHLAERLETGLIPDEGFDAWRDIRAHVSKIVSLSSDAASGADANFAVEFNRYESTKRRGGEKFCSLCSSDAEVTPQREAAILFAPQVYTNRQGLHGTQAIRHICAVCGTEMMLRQILMSSSKQTGGDFEGAKHRYLFFYPTYFFTPETSAFIRQAYDKLAHTNFRTTIRDKLIDLRRGEIRLGARDFQGLDDLLLEPPVTAKNERMDDRTFKIRFPENAPVTFHFLALPPGRDATDTESWVMPAFLGLLLPLVFDVKTVVSESPVPIFTSAEEFPETVFLDAPHQAVDFIAGKRSFRLDTLLPALQRLVAAYTIHLDVNNTSKDYYNWGALAGVARNLETSPLYVFDYLNAWLRKQTGLETIPSSRRKVYFKFYEFLDPEGKAMSHALELVRLYRSFYRAKRRNAKSNAVLKPIDVAAQTLIETRKGGTAYRENEALTEAVAAEVSALMQRVHARGAEGKPTMVFRDGRWRTALTPEQEREKILEFARYFVEEVFVKSYGRDRTRLTGKQLNLLKSTCEFLYRREDDLEKVASPAEEPEELEAEDE